MRTALYFVYAIVFTITVAGMWKAFVKAGQPGWAAIVPFYSLYVLCVVAGCPALFWVLGGSYVLACLSFMSMLAATLSAASDGLSTGPSGVGFAGLLFAGICWMVAWSTWVYLTSHVARAFGKGEGLVGLVYFVGLLFLPFIFWPILGFGSAEWSRGAKSSAAAPAAFGSRVIADPAFPMARSAATPPPQPEPGWAPGPVPGSGWGSDTGAYGPSDAYGTTNTFGPSSWDMGGVPVMPEVQAPSGPPAFPVKAAEPFGPTLQGYDLPMSGDDLFGSTAEPFASSEPTEDTQPMSPGWYPVAGDQGHQAWWDGASWTAQQRWNGSGWTAI